MLPVRLLGSGRLTAIGWLTDISLSGAHVQTLAALATMTRITMEVDRRWSDESLQLRARVVRQGPKGVGVEWEEFASGMLSELLQADARALAHGHRVSATSTVNIP
jgi:hypothetical protein